MPHTHRRSSNASKLKDSRMSTHPDRQLKSEIVKEESKEPEKLADCLLRHHSICTRLTDVTFTGDKVADRLVSSFVYSPTA